VTAARISGTLGRLEIEEDVMANRMAIGIGVAVVLAAGACGDDDGGGDPDGAIREDAAAGLDTGPGDEDSGPGPVDAGGGEDAPAAADTWGSFAMGFFATYCVECHQDPVTVGRRDYRTIDHVRRDMARIRCGVAPTTAPGCTAPAPRMFPIGDGPFPSDDERQRLVDWIDAGLPE
jgi:hypothetical protein